MDFTLTAYKQLISTLQAQSFVFQTFEGFTQNPKEKVLIFRHDVDRLPENALITAKIEKKADIKASYYFRKLKVKSEKLEGDVFSEAIRDFERNLEKLREFYPVKTICMHGSPLSKYDNKKLWENYDYRDYGIIAEPYFDIDFDEVFYLSDTGRSWNNSDANVRDKVVKAEVGGQRLEVGGQKTQQGDGSLAQSRKCIKNSHKDVGIKELETKKKGRNFDNLRFRSTFDIIEAAENGELPDKIMMNVHPQRWTNDYVPWVRELVGQNFKNVFKRQLNKFRNLRI